MRKEDAEKAVNQYGSIRAAARAMKCSRDVLSRTLKQDASVKTEKEAPKLKRSVIMEKELLAIYDPETRITSTLREIVGSLARGHYMRDADMRKECRATDIGMWRDIREQEEFWEYAMVIGNHAEPMIYWGHPESVKGLISNGKARVPAWEKRGL